MKNTEYRGKRIVIMGASSGIGLRAAEILASRGIRVGLAARHTKTLEALKKKYPELVEYSRIDVTLPDAGKELYRLIERLGGMDIYFHVAGIGFENLTLDPVREVEIMETNMVAFARMLCYAYRYFRDKGRRGHIAAITSVAGTKGIGRLSAYSASKRGAQTYMVALEQLAHNEHADITFTDIRPGWVDTPLLRPGVKYPLEMTEEYAVLRILRAIARRRRVAVIDWRWNIVVGLWRLIPNSLWIRLNIPVSSPDTSLPAPAKKE